MLPAYWNCSYETFNCYFIGLFGSIKRIRKRGNFLKFIPNYIGIHEQSHFRKIICAEQKFHPILHSYDFGRMAKGNIEIQKNTSVQKVYLEILFQAITRNVRGISLCIFSCFSLFKLIPTTSSRRICTIKLLIEFATGAAIHHRDEFPSLLKA